MIFLSSIVMVLLCVLNMLASEFIMYVFVRNLYAVTCKVYCSIIKFMEDFLLDKL